jgi:cell division septation protein DedD
LDDEATRRRRSEGDDDDDEATRRRRSEGDDEDEASRRRREGDDDDDDEATRRRRSEGDDDDDEASRRRRSEGDDDDEASRRRREGDDDDEATRRRRSEGDDDDEASRRRREGDDGDDTNRRRRRGEPAPTQMPTREPTLTPTNAPTQEPTRTPTAAPTQEPTRTPTAAPTQEPTRTPTAAPTEEPTVTPTDAPTIPGLCDEGLPNDLRFDVANVVLNNLGGVGPDSGPEKLLLANVTTVGGNAVDVEIVATSPFTTNANGVPNGVAGDFLRINQLQGTSVDLTWTFRMQGSGLPVALEGVALTVWDFDKGPDPGQLVESMTIGPVDAYYVKPNTEIIAQALGNSFYSATASTWGTGADNPIDRYDLRPHVASKAITVTAYRRSTFNMTLSTTPGWGGRNFFFSGKSQLLCEEPVS